MSLTRLKSSWLNIRYTLHALKCYEKFKTFRLVSYALYLLITVLQEFQKSLGSKQPVYDTTVRSGKAMRDKATLSADTQKLDNLLGEVRDKWDTVCGKSVER